MNVNPYIEKINKLVKGDIEEIVVEQPEFMIFREAWLEHNERKYIVGKAGLNGKIVYTFQK